MSVSLIQSVVSLPQSSFPPLAVGFFGLGTGYLIYGPQELFGYPARNDSVDFGTGVWGIWMPGFMQFITGVYLFAGLTLFGTFKMPSLYMAALAFTAYGVHWFAMGWNRLRRTDPRVNVGMTIAFLLISILGSSSSSRWAMPRWAACSSAWPASTPSTSWRASNLTCRSSEAGASGRWASFISAPGSGLCTWCSPWC
jgi:hypothetical protein